VKLTEINECYRGIIASQTNLKRYIEAVLKSSKHETNSSFARLSLCLAFASKGKLKKRWTQETT